MAEEPVPELRVCSKCGQIKPLELFSKNRHVAGGRTRRCKQCTSENTKRYREANPDRVKAALARWYARKGRAYRREWAQKNVDKVRAYKKNEAVKYSAKNVERVRQWRADHPDERRAQARAEAARRRSTPRGRLDEIMATAIGAALRGSKQGRAWETLVGYTVEDLMLHLERRFLPGMSWANYGKWHVDHIVPKSAFNYSEPEHVDFSRCWSLQNLQPLWAVDNLSKGAKLSAPFQPSLAI